MLNASISDKELDEAKLQIFQDLDAPSTPQNKAYPMFVYGITDEIKQKRRQEIFNATKSDILRAAEKHLTGSILQSTAILGYSDHCPDEIKSNPSKWTLN